jgi:hypothetical protein
MGIYNSCLMVASLLKTLGTTRMKKAMRLIFWMTIVIALTVSFVYAGMSGLSLALRTFPVGNAQETSSHDREMSGLSRALKTLPVENSQVASALDALSAQVLDASLRKNSPTPEGMASGQLVQNPAFVYQRQSLVTTWIHATRMFMSLHKDPPQEGAMLSSASLTSVSPEDRVDGWGNPYCIGVQSKHMIFLSSGGKGMLVCERLVQTALLAASKATNSRLAKDGDVLIAVYNQARQDDNP